MTGVLAKKKPLGALQEPTFSGLLSQALPDNQFYKDVGNRLYDLVSGGVQDVFTPPARWSDPNWSLRGMEAQAWQNNPAGELNRVMSGPMGMAPLGMTMKVKPGYQGQHTPPMSDSGAPAFDLTGGGKVYPDDVYGPMAARYYGHGDAKLDYKTVAIAHSLRNRPDATVTIYRAIPHEATPSEQIATLEKQMAEYMRRGKTPDGSSGSGWYNKAYEEVQKLKTVPEQPQATADINPGDWVTINRDYAKMHGESTLEGKYRIIAKKVKAKDIFTNGDSIHEWGYDPKP